MAISKAEKAAYNDEIKDLKKEVDLFIKDTKNILTKKKKMPNIASYLNIEYTFYLMRIINIYLKMSDLSLEMLKIKNERFLNDARKEFYKILQTMEEVVGNEIDRTLKSNDEYLVKIEKFSPADVLDLVDKINTVFFNLKNKVGESSKWKWSFVELQARVAVITKNITNFSDVAKLRDPRTEYYQDRREMMQLCKDGLTEAAKQYRNKYELSGRARDDLKKSIEFLSALRKIHVLFGESEDAEKIKKTIAASKQALQAEDEAKEAKKNKKK